MAALEQKKWKLNAHFLGNTVRLEVEKGIIFFLNVFIRLLLRLAYKLWC